MIMNQQDLESLSNVNVLSLMQPPEAELDLSQWEICHVGASGFSYAARRIDSCIETIRMENAETLALVVEFLNGASTKIILPR